MAGVSRLTDIDSGHDACAPRPIVDNCSSDVFTNKLPTAKVGSILDTHECIEHPAHMGMVSVGSPTVYVNGVSIARIGDLVSCGGSLVQGSSNVFSN